MSFSASNTGYAMRYDYDRPSRNYTANNNSKHNHSLDRMIYNGESTALYGTVAYTTPKPIPSPLALLNSENAGFIYTGKGLSGGTIITGGAGRNVCCNYNRANGGLANCAESGDCCSNCSMNKPCCKKKPRKTKK